MRLTGPFAHRFARRSYDRSVADFHVLLADPRSSRAQIEAARTTLRDRHQRLLTIELRQR